MSEPRFGEWTATADRVPVKPGLVICEWETVGGPMVGEALYNVPFGWRVDGDRLVDPPVRWMPMPEPGETAGPGEATRKVLRELAKGLDYCPGESRVTLGVDSGAIRYRDVIDALRECGIEVES